MFFFFFNVFLCLAMPHDLRDLSSPTRDQTQALSYKSVDWVLNCQGIPWPIYDLGVLELWEFIFSILHYHFSERFCAHWKRVYSLFEKKNYIYSGLILFFWFSLTCFESLFLFFMLSDYSLYFCPSKSELGWLFYTLKCPEWNDFVLVRTLKWSLLDIEFWFWIAFA